MNKNSLLTARYWQPVAHLAYFIFATIGFYGLERPWYYYPMLIASNLAFYRIFLGVANRLMPEEAESFASLTPLISAGTIVLNTEGYALFVYFLASAVAMFSRAFFRYRKITVFNPGAVGVFLVVMLFPHYAQFSYGTWKSEFWLALCIIGIGSTISFRGRRFAVSMAYFFGFSAIAIVAGLAAKAAHVPFNGLGIAPVLFWPASLFQLNVLAFTFHMITDPKTSPESVTGQLWFGFTIALVDFALRVNLLILSDIIAYMLVQMAYATYRLYLLERASPRSTITFAEV